MSPAGDGPVRVDATGPLTVVTVDSPPLNLFDDAMLTGLRAAIAQLAEDPPRGVLFRAEGRVVSGGVGAVRSFLEHGPGKATFEGR